jgi:pimeloyl-ACP methyl ester carboxylesterase
MRASRADIATPRGNFAALTWGDASSSLVLALHGFPDEASTFDRLAPPLVERGFWVVSVYLRGFAPSTTRRPWGAQSLGRDVAALLVALGNRPALLLGHDMGAQAAYALFDLPERDPLRLSGLCTLSLPHPGVVRRNMLRSPHQLAMSRYILWFQTRALADWSMRRNGFAAVERLWRRWSPRYRPTSRRLARVKASLAPGWPAPIGHYREGGFGGGSPGCIDVPWLYLAGGEDGCTLPEMREGQGKFAGARHQEHVFQGLGHFLQLEAPSAVASAMEDFFLHRAAAASAERPSDLQP